MKKIALLFLAALPAISFAQQKFTIIPGAGYSWRTAKISSGLPSDQREYIKSLKSGFHFDVSAYYRLNSTMGIGAKFNNYSAESDGNFVLRDVSGQTLTVSGTKDQITFVGPSFLYSNFESDTRHKLYYDLALGVLSYTTDSGFMVGKGSTFGLAATISYMYQIVPAVCVGPQLGFTGGVLSKMKFNGLESDLNGEKESLHRASLGLGAAFRF